MLEKMSEFFEKRLDGYDEHMLTEIDSANEFYHFTAELLPKAENAQILDLGCGTGLELEFYFKQNPSANITGIDLSGGMLDALRAKFSDKNLSLIQGSYFDVPFGEAEFDGAVSVESLHHFTKEEKTPLYKKLHKALKQGGYFILTDYFAPSNEEEAMYRQNLLNLKAEQGIDDNEFYHYDTPLTVEHEKEALIEAGFYSVEIIRNWGATYTLKAIKEELQMERVCKFLKDAGVYYLATVEGDQPRVRPFGTAHIFEGKLYIQTGKIKPVAKQIETNPKAELCAFKDGVWLRIACELVEDDRVEARKSMLDEYSDLRRMYDENDGNTQVLYLKNAVATFSSFTSAPEVVEF